MDFINTRVKHNSEYFLIPLYVYFFNLPWYQSSSSPVFQQNGSIGILFPGIQIVQLQAFHCIGL